MSKRVLLKLDGDLEQRGFQVTLEIGEEGKLPFVEQTGYLPPSFDLIQCLDRWQQSYRELSELTRIVLKSITVQTAPLSQLERLESCRQLTKALEHQFKIWVGSESFRSVDQQLRASLSVNESIRILIRAENDHIHHLPWHLWDFIEQYSRSEIAIGSPSFQSSEPEKIVPRHRIRILAILGSSSGINVEADRRLLQSLPDVELKFLVEPKREQISDQLWEQSWDILFFAGHSQTEQNIGKIDINSQDSLTIEELRYGLRRAIARGLKLAIFNSCDGLGLARALTDLSLPQLIVMREPVPDLVAQAFLKHFLTAFSRDVSFYASVREAREKLQGLEDQFPSASWLPVICQNPAKIPPTWRDLKNASNRKRQSSLVGLRQNLRAALLASAAVLAGVWGLRQLGALEFWELKAYDQMMQLRPAESEDSRLLLITVTADDMKIQPDRKGSSLSNGALEKLLKKLNPYNPAVIGMDIYRDFRVEPNYPQLIDQYQQNDRFIAVCSIAADQASDIAPPTEIPKDSRMTRVGFSNILFDWDDTIRRQLLAQDPPVGSKCQTNYSFSSAVALRYLKNKGIEPDDTKTSPPEIGDVVFKPLTSNAGGYHQIDSRGYQIMLNYRASEPIAPQLTLTEVLQGKDLSREMVEGKIVLIGTTDPSYKDYHPTPYSHDASEKAAGIEVQAQMVSQILSLVNHERSQIWWLPEWGEFLWIVGWSLAGGWVIWWCRSPALMGLAGVGAIALLYGCCYVLLAFEDGWMPIVPSILAMVAVSGAMVHIKSKVDRS